MGLSFRQGMGEGESNDERRKKNDANLKKNVFIDAYIWPHISTLYVDKRALQIRDFYSPSERLDIILCFAQQGSNLRHKEYFDYGK